MEDSEEKRAPWEGAIGEQGEDPSRGWQPVMLGQCSGAHCRGEGLPLTARCRPACRWWQECSVAGLYICQLHCFQL